MPHEDLVDTAGGYVLCIGLPLQRVGEVARLLRGRAAVIATADTDGARTLLGPPAAAVMADDEGGSSHPLEVHVRAVAPAEDRGTAPAVAVVPDAGPGVAGEDAGALGALAADASRLRRLVLGALEVDLGAREATARGTPVHLSMREFDLLVTLASAPDRVWSFAELTRTVWRTGYLGDSDPVTSAVKRLRKRLRVVPELRVMSVRGIGYRLLVPL
ncbi:winged helix-turn-helix domain-containing protein [Krasilnikoviella flava]|uniref:Transcriptional regulatory protein, C terminal n=1 Tax=Krasilnikoviella flava TaxID=526729 RepID=A0A1T5KCH2_9MICO|nr:winged helix-turn-helix domain-containing protein [Krasilnikoviella flava]SKC61098.1 Transcriptional regulatory protein, C terminal [Krasilnikoviella flava]